MYTGYTTDIQAPEDKVICFCSHCNGEIYEGETFGVNEDKAICSDCINDIFERLPLEMRFAIVGYEVGGAY